MKIADALKAHLKRHKKKFHKEWEDETGFGSPYHAESLDMEALMAEIDKFCTTFEKKETNGTN